MHAVLTVCNTCFALVGIGTHSGKAKPNIYMANKIQVLKTCLGAGLATRSDRTLRTGLLASLRTEHSYYERNKKLAQSKSIQERWNSPTIAHPRCTTSQGPIWSLNLSWMSKVPRVHSFRLRAPSNLEISDPRTPHPLRRTQWCSASCPTAVEWNTCRRYRRPGVQCWTKHMHNAKAEGLQNAQCISQHHVYIYNSHAL